MISVAACAEKWGVAERTVRNYCANGRIPGAVLKGKTWWIPEDAERPERLNKRDDLPRTLLERLRMEKKIQLRGGIYHKVQVDMTYNSNHIEGSRLTHDQTRLIFETNTIGVEGEAVNVDDVVETANHFRCIDLVIENAAREPHIVDLANFLNSMGADVRGAGTDTIKINGVDALHGGTYTIIPDQIEAGTYMVAAAATGGEVLVTNIIPKHMEGISAKLREAGAFVEEYEEAILVKGPAVLRRINLKTMPYPGFPTDMQPQFGVLMCLADGTSVITEGIYDNRFKYVNELRKMGAEIQVDGRVAVIEGGRRLTGAMVHACDLRAGAAMVIAGMVASGVTEIDDIHYIERGYERFVEKLNALGAEIEVRYDSGEDARTGLYSVS